MLSGVFVKGRSGQTSVSPENKALTDVFSEPRGGKVRSYNEP